MRFLIATSSILIFGCGICRSANVQTKSPRVTTPSGAIEGIYKTSSEGRLIEAYLGIPYAMPPVGGGRFAIAKPVKPWKGVLRATKFGSKCMQIDESYLMTNKPLVSGSENCLFLNVYTPVWNSRSNNGKRVALIPVIIFIHGGGFQIGDAARYGPDYLLNRDVILVTFNHRVGPLGFMSTEDDTMPGNMGLKDQVIAIRWVSKNIYYFGGDPKRVTLVGQGSGATSVHYHYMTNLTAGMFQGGLSISGTALNCWAQTENSLMKTKRLAATVGCPTKVLSSMVNCLKTKPANKITLASTQFMHWLGSPFVVFGPVVERGKHPFKFIDQPPLKSILAGRMLNPPWIATSVSQESLVSAIKFITDPKRLKELNDRWVEIAPHLLDYEYTVSESDKKAVSLGIRNHYLGKRAIDKSTVPQVLKLINDRMFGYDYEEAAMLQAQSIMSPVRFAHFSYRGAHSFTDAFTRGKTNYGVSFYDDLSYVLKSYFDPTTTVRDRKMQKVMIDFWVSYATKGVPDVGVKWPSIDPDQDQFQFLHIRGPDDIHMNGTLNYGDKEFWLYFPFNENVVPKSH